MASPLLSGNVAGMRPKGEYLWLWRGVRWLLWSLLLAGRGRLRWRGLVRALRPELVHFLIVAAAHQVEEHAARGSSTAAVLDHHPALLLNFQRFLTEGERFLRPENPHHGLELLERLPLYFPEFLGNRRDGFGSVHRADCRKVRCR